MGAPCGGCPPCCKSCVFAQTGNPTVATARVVVAAEEYGCVHGGAVVQDTAGELGLLRERTGFHPVTESGAAFLRRTGNPLAAHLAG